MILCKNCGHPKEEHQNDSCNIATFLGLRCSCTKFIEIEINNDFNLSKEFSEAYTADQAFLESSKNHEGVYIIKDMKKAILLHERQVFLWKKLTKQ